MNHHKSQCDYDAGYAENPHSDLEGPVIEYKKLFAELDLEAALTDPENLAFVEKYERAVQVKRDEEKLNYFFKGLDEWLINQLH